MKFTHLRTHFNADDAYLIISFLGEISDALWAVYGADVIEQQRQARYDDDNQLDEHHGEIP